MEDSRYLNIKYCPCITAYNRRSSDVVLIGDIPVGGDNPVAVQTMTDTDTNDTQACIDQIGRVYSAGGRIVRLTAQGSGEAENLKHIADQVKKLYTDTALVADVHFLPEVAAIAARYVDKVRINPGNYNDKGGDFHALLEECRDRGVSLRIGVNHGSLSERMVSRWGDTPRGMVESAMEFLRICRNAGFGQVGVSMKSSNTRVMVHAYRMLVAAMNEEGMKYPIHLGVTEAGNGIEGRIKSAVGIGAMLADGIGDTIRVSLTEAPEAEIPVAGKLVSYFAQRASMSASGGIRCAPEYETALFNPYEYNRRKTYLSGMLGGDSLPLIMSELERDEREPGGINILTAESGNPVGEWRSKIIGLDRSGNLKPVILHRKYDDTDIEDLALKAGADFGVMFIDGLADGIYIESTTDVKQDIIDSISLDILQASRARMSKTEFIACPGCGRTLFGLHETLEAIKESTSHLKGLKIGVMGCIVNGPGEMADADYGYVGAGPGRITLYRGKEPVRKNIPQGEALDSLIGLIKSDGRWIEPETGSA